MAGVENMVVYGQYKEDQHLVLLVVQESDGLDFDPSIESKEEEEMENVQSSHDGVGPAMAPTTLRPERVEPFPDIFIRFDSKDGPSPSDLQEMKTMFNDFVAGLDRKN